MDNYIPQPIDTSNVSIPSELGELLELLAKNTHEVWATHRMREGWSYGPERNDGLKQTPNMVPYEELEEVEKKYDREISAETIRLILKLGFSINRKS